jgi:hypothetical protein
MEYARSTRLPDHPVTVDPPVRGAGQALGVNVERPTGRTTLTPRAWPARLVQVDGDGMIRPPSIPEPECPRRRRPCDGLRATRGSPRRRVRSARRASSEHALARRLVGRLQGYWRLIIDRGFYNWPDWRAVAVTGARPCCGGQRRPAPSGAGNCCPSSAGGTANCSASQQPKG